MDSLLLFSNTEGNMLIRLIMAHLISDFVLQTQYMVDNKKWISWPMFLHISIVFFSTVLLTGWWKMALIVAATHYLIDSIKISLQKKNIGTPLQRLLTDQAAHVAVLIIVWSFYFNLWNRYPQDFSILLNNYNILLLLLAYLIVIGPIGYIVGFALQNMQKFTNVQNQSISTPGNTPVLATVNENGGKRIGIFERIIILTFVLLGQYDAIGFLITGKSIIRFSDRDGEHLRSEYVLVGTMMSYALSILTGVLVNWLLTVK